MADDKPTQSGAPEDPTYEFVEGHEPYFDVFVKAYMEVEEITKKERELAYRKAKLNDTMKALRPLIFKEVWDINTLNLSDAIRFVFSSTKRKLSALEVRSKLEDLSYSLDQFDNPLANIHTAIRRMVDTGELFPAEDENKKKTFEASPELKPIPDVNTEMPDMGALKAMISADKQGQ